MSKTYHLDFEPLVEQHGASIYRIIKAYLGASEEVDDLYQEVLINIWKALPRFKGQSKLSTWIYRITVNTAITYRQRKNRYENQNHSLDQVADLTYDDSAYKEKVKKENQLQVLTKMIEKLPKDQRIVIGLYLEDLSYKEIAEVIGRDTNYVGVKIKRIKDKLTKMMSHEQIG